MAGPEGNYDNIILQQLMALLKGGGGGLQQFERQRLNEQGVEDEIDQRGSDVPTPTPRPDDVQGSLPPETQMAGAGYEDPMEEYWAQEEQQLRKLGIDPMQVPQVAPPRLPTHPGNTTLHRGRQQRTRA